MPSIHLLVLGRFLKNHLSFFKTCLNYCNSKNNVQEFMNYMYQYRIYHIKLQLGLKIIKLGIHLLIEMPWNGINLIAE